ncbi:hypothetical protein [Streptomyces sp. NBC_00162]|uniref:hypothetical protein n=1 Tax=Streptomyces sp. NBC_00162 TaxID=2903629 RepID=UPI002AFFB5AC|nr:hypothetical protein [Streptomyces sp. NBC_00162]
MPHVEVRGHVHRLSRVLPLLLLALVFPLVFLLLFLLPFLPSFLFVRLLLFLRLLLLLARRAAAGIAVAEKGEKGFLHTLSEQFIADGIVVIDKGGKFRNSMQKLLHYLGGQCGEFPSQDAGPLAARAGPDAVQKFAHRFLVRAGVRPVWYGGQARRGCLSRQQSCLTRELRPLVLPPGGVRPHSVPRFCRDFAVGDA